MSTAYSTRSKPVTAYSKRVGPTTDLGVGLDELDFAMTDENDNCIVFHTGNYIEKKTEYSVRVKP